MRPPAEEPPIGPAESASSEDTRPPDPPDEPKYWRETTVAGVAQVVSPEDLLAHSDTTHDAGEALTNGVVWDALLRASSAEVADVIGASALVGLARR